MTHLIWAERLLLGALLLFAIAAGAENTWLGIAGLAVTALCTRLLIVDARSRGRASTSLTPLQQRQREQLRVGRWS